jgi:broad specificity phosphatase PhoE
MKIYIFRHAQKEVDFSRDPDLTIEGHQQADKLLEKVLNNDLPTPTQIWASPKKRTFSTFQPLANHLHLKVMAHDDLNEQLSHESIKDFRLRIEKLFNSVNEKSGEILFLCTHYDWLIEAVSLLASDIDSTHPRFSNWSPGQHIGFKFDGSGFFEFIEISHL